MILMDYPSIRGDYLPYYAKHDNWKILHAYIDACFQISIDEYPGVGVQAITRLQSQCANMTIAENISYNILLRQVGHKKGYSAINYARIFQNDKDLSISVGNNYSEYQLIHTFLGHT